MEQYEMIFDLYQKRLNLCFNQFNLFSKNGYNKKYAKKTIEDIKHLLLQREKAFMEMLFSNLNKKLADQRILINSEKKKNALKFIVKNKESSESTFSFYIYLRDNYDTQTLSYHYLKQINPRRLNSLLNAKTLINRLYSKVHYIYKITNLGNHKRIIKKIKDSRIVDNFIDRVNYTIVEENKSKVMLVDLIEINDSLLTDSEQYNKYNALDTIGKAVISLITNLMTLIFSLEEAQLILRKTLKDENLIIERVDYDKYTFSIEHDIWDYWGKNKTKYREVGFIT